MEIGRLGRAESTAFRGVSSFRASTAQSGIPGQRTGTFSSLKLTKTFVFDHSVRFQADLEVFNLFNGGAPATSTSYLTGLTHQVTDIVSPRVARVGLKFSF